ncbi:restriction endonuclease subunit S [Citricoccus nitrophenolicus]
MSDIDELIAGLSPNGVEYKTLGQVGTFVRGSGLQKADLRDEGIPAVHYGQIHTIYGVSTAETKSFTDEEIAVKLRHAKPGDLLIATTSEDDDAVAKATAWLGSTDLVLSGDAYIYRHELDPMYVAYFFESKSFQDQKRRYISGTKVRRISGDSLAKIRIPVPPLQVQKKISGMLDRFTQLEAELETALELELEARRIQYAHFLSLLTRVDEGVSLVALGDIAEFKYGYTNKASASGTHRFIRITDIGSHGRLLDDGAKFVSPDGAADDYLVQLGDILMARTGGTFGKTMLFESDEPSVYASFLIRVRFPGGALLPAFYWYFAQSTAYWDQANALVSTGGQPQFNANALKRVLVPVPTFDAQQKVVERLRRLESAATGLNEALAVEQVSRRRQYKYYRDRLFTFKELAA